MSSVGFTQCHFFAGIGVWSHALRLAGWDDARPVWTGSCPCQPFSAAGKRAGFQDERHLWPAWFELIRELRPRAVFGEQVASKDALAWIDHVSADLEGADYAIGAVDTCAAGHGAPHIRQRLFWVAEPGEQRREGLGLHLRERGPFEAVLEARRSGEAGRLADADGGLAGDAKLQPGGTTRTAAARQVALAWWATPMAHEARLGYQNRRNGKKGTQESLTTQDTWTSARRGQRPN
jgi:DNA (cytosine-5)-methyltransferase 1